MYNQYFTELCSEPQKKTQAYYLSYIYPYANLTSIDACTVIVIIIIYLASSKSTETIHTCKQQFSYSNNIGVIMFYGTTCRPTGLR